MGKLRRFYKRYERTFMLGIVIMLLATFSVTSALCSGTGQQGGSTYKLGGSFFVAPGEREELSDSDFDEVFNRHRAFLAATRMPSIAFRDHLMFSVPPHPILGAWSSYAGRRSAEEAGYLVGSHQLKEALRDIVSFRMRMHVTDEVYTQFLQDHYQGSPARFQDAVRGVVLRDSFLDPLVQVARYAVTYEEAFEEWKRERERVDLEYIALSGEPFAKTVALEERSRVGIAEREAKLLKVQQSLNLLRSYTAAIEAARVEAQAMADEAERDKVPYPESLEALVEARKISRVQDDPWGGEWTYTRSEDGQDYELSSAGPDQEAGTADDVTRAIHKAIVTHGELRDVVRAIYEWHGGAKKWPASLEDLLKPAVEGGAAPLPRQRKDGHDREFQFEAAADENGTPTVIALGPDGEAGTADDIRYTVEPDSDATSAAIPVGPGLAALMAGDEVDAWNNPLVAVLESAAPITWRVFSVGADGKRGTDDDVEGGNRREMEAFYAQPDVRSKYRLPVRRQIEALHVQLPVFPDEALRKLWEAYPQHHPTDEDQLFQTWQEHRGPDRFYEAKDPADAETGHGAELAKRIAPGAKHFLVPDKSIFPEQLGAAKKDGDDSEGEGDKDGNGDDGEGDDEEQPADDPLRKEYREKGWREILIRERFMDNLMRDLLQRLADSRKAVDDWDRQYADKPEDEPTPPRPELLTFGSLLEGELSPYLMGAAMVDKGLQSFRYYRTEVDPEGPEEQGDERTDWENHPEFGDTIVTVDLSGKTQDGEYVTRVVPLHKRKGRVLLRSLKYFPSRDQTLEEVQDEIFERFVKRRQVDRAVEALKDLLEASPAPSADLTGEALEAAWQKALDEWAEKLGQPYLRERTGLFIGNAPPQVVALDRDENDELPTDEASMKIRRRNFIWTTGYDTIRPLGSRQDPTSGETGSFGRRVLRDTAIEQGGTGTAYLVRVADRKFPSKAEFSPRRYTDFLSAKAFGAQGGPRPEMSVRDREGTFYVQLGKFSGDPDFLRGVWGLRTNSPLESLEALTR